MTRYTTNRSALPAILSGVLLSLAFSIPAQAQGTDPISGVQLGPSGPRQSAHAVVQRKDRAGGRHEISIPGVAQINSRFTEHYGTGLDYRFHFSELLALNVGGTWYGWNADTVFKEEMERKAQQAPLAAGAVLLEWDAHAGLEFTPFYGKFSFFQAGVVHFGVYLGAGLGVADTRVQLRPAAGDNRPRTFGDTGLRPIGSLNAGMRMFLGDRFALRFEVRDVAVSNEISRINGCTLSDLQGSEASSSCRMNDFFELEPDRHMAKGFLEQPSSAVLHNVSFVGSFSVLF